MKQKSNYHEIGGRLSKLKNLAKLGFNPKYLIYRYKWNYYPRLRKVAKFPMHIDIESTDNCNLRCVMCPRNFAEEKLGFVDLSFAKKLIDEGAKFGLYSIKFNWRGEPLMHPQIVDLVRHAHEKGVIEVQFNTNGLMLDDKMARGLIDAGLDKVIFSVDAATKKTYEDIRRGGNYDTLVSNINHLVELRNSMGRKKPLIRVQMVKMKENEAEVQQFIDTWTGVVDAVAVNDYGNPQKKDDVDRDAVGDISIGRQACPQIWQRLMISWDGNVMMCCGDWGMKNVLGNAKTESLYDIWHGEKLKKIRALHKAGALEKVSACKDCHVKESHILAKPKGNKNE